MKSKNILLLLVCIAFFSCQSQVEKINGLSFVASHSKIDANNVKPVLKVNGNYVALMPFGFIRDLNNPTVMYNSKRQWFGETKKGLEHYANEFIKSKVKIMIKPQIWVSRGLYTGLIEMHSQENWLALEKSYEKFILDYAEIAQRMKVEMFCIGTELEKFVKHRPAFWSQLIAKIRKTYSGKLTYAANWDEFKRVPFWEEVDYIGIDAYFPLSDKKTPSVADLEEGWIAHKKNIRKVQEDFDKPILFTEYGYRSLDYTGKAPWESNRIVGKVNFVAQNNALQALYNQFWNEKWFAGGFVWKWFHNHEKSGGEQNNRFTPQNKPAEELIKKRYGQ